MKAAMFLALTAFVLCITCGFTMQTASPNPTPAALPSSTELPSPLPPQKLPQKIRVSQGVSDGMLIHRVEPVLPPDAKKMKGDVVLALVINREGNVVRATVLKVTKGNPILAQSALEAVRQWKYKPYLLNGEPLEVETTVTLRFKRS